ncbi:copper-binding protein [Massilia sp. Root418]|uniref:heavy-metal-associated domain-containing protein n=1 Tax=Massilia sp. Root418 TaxID=1736532 RepID=UPI0006F587E3|nr:heavy-metal-associated domain-containing protein [Massilia sp. Root418]KQW97072.1 copper-binding protein [Massilia sp. Root418]
MYQLQVEEMSCGHCVASVTKAVKAIDAQASVEVDLAGKQVMVQSGAPLDAVKAAIADAGFPVTAAQ